MTGKSKKHPVPNPVSLGTGVKAPMVSLKVKKQKEEVAREVARSGAFG